LIEGENLQQPLEEEEEDDGGDEKRTLLNKHKKDDGASASMDEHMMLATMILTVAAEVLVYIRVTERREVKWIIPTVLFILAYALFTILIYRLAI
jgi:Ca2+/Na+ antiporter